MTNAPWDSREQHTQFHNCCWFNKISLLQMTYQVLCPLLQYHELILPRTLEFGIWSEFYLFLNECNTQLSEWDREPQGFICTANNCSDPVMGYVGLCICDNTETTELSENVSYHEPPEVELIDEENDGKILVDVIASIAEWKDRQQRKLLHYLFHR